MEEQLGAQSPEEKSGASYWDARYKDNTTGWDIGEVSPPLKRYIDSIQDKDLRILIPGCGNTYEAGYLLQQGFKQVTVIDIAPTLVDKLQVKFAGNRNIQIVLGDFFTHEGEYDLILEQTFFCALPPTMRRRFVTKMHSLLKADGILAGVLFNCSFEGGPPFGGSQEEYETLFKHAFHFNVMQPCTNSILPRANNELSFELQKNNAVLVQLYSFQGITCNGCKQTVTDKFMALDGVLNVCMSLDFSELLIVSEKEIALHQLQSVIAYEEKYKIEKVN